MLALVVLALDSISGADVLAVSFEVDILSTLPAHSHAGTQYGGVVHCGWVIAGLYIAHTLIALGPCAFGKGKCGGRHASIEQTHQNSNFMIHKPIPKQL